MDGTLIESYASIKSFVPRESDGGDTGDDDDDSSSGGGFKSRNAEVDFHGHKRSNATHHSRSDPEAKLYHIGHTLAENRHGLIFAVAATEAGGKAECAAALAMIDDLHERRGVKPTTLGADKGYDSGPWMIQLESRDVTPHVAMRDGPIGGAKGTSRLHKKNRPSVDARQRMANRMNDIGYTISQHCRKKIEEGFGWLKTIAGLVRTRLVGRWKLRQQLEVSATAYNLVRMRMLLAEQYRKPKRIVPADIPSATPPTRLIPPLKPQKHGFCSSLLDRLND